MQTKPDIFVVKVASYLESEAVAEMRKNLKANGQSFAKWQKEIIAECKWAFDTWGLSTLPSRDSFEVRFATLEQAEQAVKGLEPEIRLYVTAATLTPIQLAGIL